VQIEALGFLNVEEDTLLVNRRPLGLALDEAKWMRKE
jgi:hypothetical protein